MVSNVIYHEIYAVNVSDLSGDDEDASYPIRTNDDGIQVEETVKSFNDDGSLICDEDDSPLFKWQSGILNRHHQVVMQMVVKMADRKAVKKGKQHRDRRHNDHLYSGQENGQ